MATEYNKTLCVTCGKDKASYTCEGCSQTFCYNHLGERRQKLSLQLDGIENERNLFLQNLLEEKTKVEKGFLMEQINEWEQESIDKIKQTAEETRELVRQQTNKIVEEIDLKLKDLTQQIEKFRNENDLNEINLSQLKTNLKYLQKQFNQTKHLKIKQQSSHHFIQTIFLYFSRHKLTHFKTHFSIRFKTKIFVKTTKIFSFHNFIQINKKISFLEKFKSFTNSKWIQNAISILGENGQGYALNQLNHPTGIYIDQQQNIYVTDYSNHRIIELKKGETNGRIIAGGNGQGNRNDQLSRPWNVIIDEENDCLIISDSGNRRVVRWPRQNGETIISNVHCFGLAIDRNGFLYASDLAKSEVRRWKRGEKDGTLVAGGNEYGHRLDQFNTPYHIFVDENDSVYVSDAHSHRVMKWIKGAKEGIVVAGGQSEGYSLTQLSYPRGIIVDELETLYVADYGNHRVMRWLKGAREGDVVVGGNGYGRQANQLNRPSDLSFDEENNLYVVDCYNNRVQKFSIEKLE